MNEIYWITRLDLISGWLIVFAVIAAVATIVAIVSYIANRDSYETYKREEDKRWEVFSKKLFQISLPCFFVFVISSILTPTTNEALLVYGVGTTIDYIQSNEIVNQLPDKCVKALDTWVDSLVSEEHKD